VPFDPGSQVPPHPSPTANYWHVRGRQRARLLAVIVDL
jgi:hypothetical protein